MVFSPYITSPLAIRAVAVANPKLAAIYTRFDIEAFASRASSIHALEALQKAGHPLFEVPGLHAKIIIAGGQLATVGSQNLTAGGTRNREATVIITDPEEIERLKRQTDRWVADARPITSEMIADVKAILGPIQRAMKKVQRACRDAERQVVETELMRSVELKKREAAAETLRLEAVRSRDAALQAARAAQLAAYQKERGYRLLEMGAGSFVPHRICRSVLWNATQWERTPGDFVHACKDANNMKRGAYGYELALGSNRFLVELGIKRVREKIESWFPKSEVRAFTLTGGEKTELQEILRTVVAGSGNRIFRCYPIDSSDRMKLGNHYVNLRNTVAAILYFSWFDREERVAS